MKKILLNATTKFLSGFLPTLLIALILYFIIPFAVNLKLLTLIIFSILSIFLILLYYIRPILQLIRPMFAGDMDLPESDKNQNPIFLLLYVMVIVFTFPAIIIYWVLKPEDIKKAIEITVLLISISAGLIYYFKNKEKFPKPSDKITFFTGVFLGPVGIVKILF